ncbi:MAG TPA: hypothetical protein VHQ97_07965 [Solirubrobacterales bacterium]|jgi:hypothetical protein|nr:hypothetical protein [Solirubrobacterales bacterium]
MLAYLFWHRPREGVDPERYEEALREFHSRLETESACFRLGELPFDPGPGYEDWYLVDDWSSLGRLNEAAVDAARRPAHDHAADDAGAGWGAVYSLVRGAAEPPAGAEWHDKPRLVPTDTFLADLPETTIWRRELALGPAPEFCVAVPGAGRREPIWGPDQGRRA